MTSTEWRKGYNEGWEAALRRDTSASPPLTREGWVSLEILRKGPPLLVKSEPIFGNEVKVKVEQMEGN